VNINGTTYDAKTGAILPAVDVDMYQANYYPNGTGYWCNNVSSASGEYTCKGFLTNKPIEVFASKTGYFHVENFSVTPLEAGTYIMDIYLMPTDPCPGSVCGLTLSYPWHQALGQVNVTLSNATFSNSTLSNITTGYFEIPAYADGSYNLSGVKTKYTPITETITVTGGTNVSYLVLHPVFNLTIKARDYTTTAMLSNFTAYKGGVDTQSVNGSIIYPVDYGIYTISVQATNYYPSQKTIFVSEDKEVIFDLAPVSSTTSSVITYSSLHAIRWIVLALNGTRYPGVNVTSTQAGNVSTALTGTDGSVVFWMNSTLYYDLTFIKTSQGINLTWSGYPYDGTYFIYTNGTIVFVPTAITNTTLTNYTIQYTNESWSLQNLTGTYLTSSMGLGPTAQGILVGTLSYVIAGAAGPVGIVLSMCILALLGIITWVMVLFVAMTILALYVLLGGVGSSW